MQSCILGNLNSCLTMMGCFLKPHTLKGRKKSSKIGTNMPIPKPSFPSYNRTPKHHGYLNTLHPNPRDEFRTCWGRVEEFLVAGEQEIVHTKPFFYPFSSVATYTNHPLEVDQVVFLGPNLKYPIPMCRASS
ncbi:hypothetical protein Taro_056329 [Colocasia esculenta]|uniref:Uncharacterized protein n=1 Tax=Colocasia esculenta TaxID=4460 RepID=A0A843XVF4_COLES|nr:hypothetical protein [Colocasia esculenta]